MNFYNIKCTCGCGKILGQVETEFEYLGDSYYCMYAEGCDIPLIPKTELELLKKELQDLKDSLSI